MARRSMSVMITPPGGEPVTVPVKRSTQVRLEEELGVPVLARIQQGFTGSLHRFAYAVGRDHGVIPESLSFDDFLDTDDEWEFELVPPDDDADPKS